MSANPSGTRPFRVTARLVVVREVWALTEEHAENVAREQVRGDVTCELDSESYDVVEVPES